MTIHYHGLPLTPGKNLQFMEGKNFCVSYATRSKQQVEFAIKHGQSVMWDNGAFSVHTKGKRLDVPAFYEWIGPKLGHPHWAVVPDEIGGDVDAQRRLTATWPFPKPYGAPVWHLHLSLEYLLELADNWPRICIGSSAQFWKIGTPEWCARMDEAFNHLAQHRVALPWIHGMRMLSKIGGRWPLASADSVNVARNYNTKRVPVCPGCMANRIDRVQGEVRWPTMQYLLS